MGAAVVSRPIQVSLLVEDQPCHGPLPIGAVGLTTETVEDRLLALGSELEYDAACEIGAGAVIRVGYPAAEGRPIQISLLVEDQPCRGPVPIGAVGLRTEAVEDYLLAFGSEFEYDAACFVTGVGAFDVVQPASDGGPIQVSLLVEDQPCNGRRPVGAVGLTTETVEDRLLARGCELEYDSLSVGPAACGRPIQVSFLVEDQPCRGIPPSVQLVRPQKL